MKKLGFILVLLVCLGGLCNVYADDGKKVAILEVVDKEGTLPYGTKFMVRNKLTAAISNTPGYEGFDRVDLASIIGEQNFQRTGMVSNEQITRIGEMTGASYVLVAECALLGEDNLSINAKILQVETARIEFTADVRSRMTVDEVEKACHQLASKLLDGLLEGSMVAKKMKQLEKDNARLNELNQNQARMIATLKKQLAESEALIESLRQELGSLIDAYVALDSALRNTRQ